jgi:murein DD-endopeptidase
MRKNATKVWFLLPALCGILLLGSGRMFPQAKSAPAQSTSRQSTSAKTGAGQSTSGQSAAAQSAAQQSAAPQSTAAIEGKWEGTLGSGSNQLRLQIDFYKLPTGALAGDLNSVDQGVDVPMSLATLTDKKVHFEIRRIGGVYEGTLSDDGSQIQGTWTQTGVSPQELDFRRPGAAQAAPVAPPPPTTKPFTAPLDIFVPEPPTAFAADGKGHLVYELHVTNFTRWDTTITKVEVMSGDSDTSLGSFSGDALDNMIVRPGQPDAKPKAKIAGGATAVIFMWVDLPTLRDAPPFVRHRVTMTYAAYPEPITVVTPDLNVNRKPVMVISPPLKGDDWLAANGPSNTSSHRRALIPIDGSARIAQRFAIDWVRLNADGNTYTGDPKDNKNYRAYGSEALAVADGTVMETLDNVPQNVPGENSRAQEITLENVAGNHIILNLGNGMYAMYAHLQPGSLKVSKGDHVRRGQVLGLVGNSGNSTEPHLHFQICDAPATLGCEGLPYAFSEFQVIGHGWGFKVNESHSATETHSREMPLEDEVVWFPQEQRTTFPRIHP